MLASTPILAWMESPPKMVRDLFGATPDAWQDNVLAAFPKTPRIAMQACTGPGKTTVLAWLAWNFMLTRPHPVVGVASINRDNLKSGLWTELARWRSKSPLLERAFKQYNESIVNVEHPDTWKLEARSWAKDADPVAIANALRGLHADFIMWILDECGGMPDAVLATCEAIFSGEPTEAHIIMAGNPTNLSGPLYTAATIAREHWKVVEITADPDDPMRTPRVSKAHALQQIAQWGIDNPWVRVNIFGKFPRSSMNTLIGPSEISEAQRRSYREGDIAGAPRVLGVDVARFGDDKSVIFPRQGLVAFRPMIYRDLDGVQGGGIVARKWGDWNVDATFIDNSGGYGASWIDNLRLLGRSPVGIGFADMPNNPRYANKRAEMYFEAAEWIKGGGQLPGPDVDGMAEFASTMTQTTYSFKGDRMILEPKELLKARIRTSPDVADELCAHICAARGC